MSSWLETQLHDYHKFSAPLEPLLDSLCHCVRLTKGAALQDKRQSIEATVVTCVVKSSHAAMQRVLNGQQGCLPMQFEGNEGGNKTHVPLSSAGSCLQAWCKGTHEVLKQVWPKIQWRHFSHKCNPGPWSCQAHESLRVHILQPFLCPCNGGWQAMDLEPVLEARVPGVLCHVTVVIHEALRDKLLDLWPQV